MEENSDGDGFDLVVAINVLLELETKSEIWGPRTQLCEISAVLSRRQFIDV